jgi:hypothetical protein
MAILSNKDKNKKKIIIINEKQPAYFLKWFSEEINILKLPPAV